MPGQIEQFKLPAGVNERLHDLLDRQDSGEALTASEREEAEGLIDLAEMLSRLRLRAHRIWREEQPIRMRHIPAALRGRVIERSGGRCEYSRLSQSG
jgi:hypothetical protein